MSEQNALMTCIMRKYKDASTFQYTFSLAVKLHYRDMIIRSTPQPHITEFMFKSRAHYM